MQSHREGDFQSIASSLPSTLFLFTTLHGKATVLLIFVSFSFYYKSQNSSSRSLGTVSISFPGINVFDLFIQIPAMCRKSVKNNHTGSVETSRLSLILIFTVTGH